MAQCPSCKSWCGADASFCGQCGCWLGLERRPRGRAKKGGWFGLDQLRLPFLAAFLIVAAAGGVLWVVVWSERRVEESGHALSSSKDGAGRHASESGDAPAQEPGADEAVLAVEKDESDPLDEARAAKLASGALVVLDLRNEDDRPLRETRGVIVDPDGVVLSGFRPLLGAYRGRCRLSGPQESHAEIAGISYSVEALDYALIRLEERAEEYPYVPLLEEASARAFKRQEALFALNGEAALSVRVQDPDYRGLDGVPRVLLADGGASEISPFLAMTRQGQVVGLVRWEVDGRIVADGKPRVPKESKALVDPANSLVPWLGRGPSLTLRELSLRVYSGTFEDYSIKGRAAREQRRWRDAVDLFEKALERVPYDLPGEEEIGSVTRNLRESYLEEIHRLAESGRMDEAALLAEAALARFTGDGALLLLLGEARMEQNDWSAAISALVQARDITSNQRAETLLEKAYLQLAAGAGAAGDLRNQELHLLQGMQQIPSSGLLPLELAKLYTRIEAYDDAVHLLERVIQVDPSLRDAAESLLERIDDAVKRRDAIVIPFPPASKSIRTVAQIDRRTDFTFIIDTGASYTAIPASAATALGYDITSPSLQRITFTAVGGTFVGPLIRVQSLSLGGYSVRNLEILVIPNDLGLEVGLLGLNFLKHFKYTVDSARSEFRLERP